MGDSHVHVFTAVYTSDVSGVCSAMYELGGMTVLHDPSGCNSTYTTHDEPRWYNSDSLMFVSGLDDITAIMGDDSVIIRDVCEAAEELQPRFITLCGSAIPHITGFDCKGVARLIENRSGIPVIPAQTDGLRMYTRGVGIALKEWMKRFADLSLTQCRNTVNLLGVTPIDFSYQANADAMREAFDERGLHVNTVCAMGESFENMTRVAAASVNIVVSSAGLLPARFLKSRCGIPYVIGTPVGSRMTDRIADAVRRAQEDGVSRYSYDADTLSDNGSLLVIGEEYCACSIAAVAAELGISAGALWPDAESGIDEEELLRRIRAADRVICDPLFGNAFGGTGAELIPLPHEGYSGRLFRNDIPVFTGDSDWLEVNAVNGRASRSRPKR